MTTNPITDEGAVRAARQGLVNTKSGGWLGGFNNLLSKELGDWFSTSRWILQSVIWLLIINGLMGFILFIVPTLAPSEQVSVEEKFSLGLSLYFNLAILFGSIGMIILTQDEIIQEKQTGTAAWILSKPVSRSAFVLSKLLSNLVGGAVFIAGFTGAVAYAEIYLATQQAVQPVPFLAGIGIIVLTLVFYLSLVIMLGTIFEQRGAVLGIAVGVLLGGQIASQFTPLVSYFLPVNMPDIALGVIQGQPIPVIGFSQLVVTGIWSLLFTLVVLWRFGSEEY